MMIKLLTSSKKYLKQSHAMHKINFRVIEGLNIKSKEL